MQVSRFQRVCVQALLTEVVNAAGDVAAAAVKAGAGHVLGPLLAARHAAMHAQEGARDGAISACIDQAAAVDAQALHGAPCFIVVHHADSLTLVVEHQCTYRHASTDTASAERSTGCPARVHAACTGRRGTVRGSTFK